MSLTVSWKKEWKAISSFDQWGRQELLALSKEHIKYLKPKKTDYLLDIGCNDGLFDVMLSPLVRRIDAIDIMPRHLKGYPNLHMRKGDILRLPQKKYDIVLCGSVLHYLRDLGEVTQAFENMSRVTKRRAFCTLIPNSKYKQQYLAGIWKLHKTNKEKRFIYGRNNAALWIDPNALRAIAREAGFKPQIVKIPSMIWQSWYMFSMVLEKPRRK
ncbi:MAG: Methyltransferase domain [Candidatus Parcubacteria bacterium]|jgi:SAM-dependent methyltransferase